MTSTKKFKFPRLQLCWNYTHTHSDNCNETDTLEMGPCEEFDYFLQCCLEKERWVMSGINCHRKGKIN